MATASQYFRPLVESSPAPPRPEREPLRILLIEDERSVTDYFRGSLRLAGYAVYRATTGGQALQRFQAARPDLILLDLSRSNGGSIAHRFRRSPRTAGHARRHARLRMP